MAIDSSGNGFHGTNNFDHVVPGLVVGLGPGSGAGYGNTVSYSGFAPPYPVAPTNSSTPSDHQYSIEIWYRQRPGDPRTASVCTGIAIQADGSLITAGPFLRTGGVVHYVDTPPDAIPQDYLPHHIVITYLCVDFFTLSSPVSFYVDGALFYAENVIGESIDPGIQNLQAGDTSGIGTYDEFAVYDYALSSGQVAAHYAQRADFDAYSAEVLGDNPRAYWHFDDFDEVPHPPEGSPGWYVGVVAMGTST